MLFTTILIVIVLLAAVGEILRAVEVWSQGYSTLWVLYSGAFSAGLLATAARLAGLI